MAGETAWADVFPSGRIGGMDQRTKNTVILLTSETAMIIVIALILLVWNLAHAPR